MHGNHRPRNLLQDSKACLLLYLTVNPSLFRRTGTERIARTGFWLSLFRFQGATGHTPIKPELVPGVPKDCSRRTAAAGKSPSGAGRLGGLPGGRVTLSGAHTRVNAFRHETAYPRRHPGPNARFRWYRRPRPKRRIPRGAPDQGFRRLRRPPTTTSSQPWPVRPHPWWRAVSHSGPPHATRCPGHNRLSAPALRQSEPPGGACAACGPPRPTAWNIRATSPSCASGVASP
jgi:hypothetical protein